MSVKRIIQESIEKNPLGVKEALEEALQERILVALEEKYKKMAMESDDEDEDEDDEDDEDEDDEDEDMDESLDLSDYTVEELEEFMESADFEQLDEISKEKMGQYVKRAHADKDTQMKRASIFDKKGIDADKDKDMYNAFGKADKARNKAGNRTKFIGKAVDKMTK
jgi:hypothetical protein